MKQKIIYYSKELIPYLIILIVIFLIKQFAFGTVLVKGHSMDNTLQDGDFMILDRVSYRLQKIKRFDVVVVQIGKQKLIKRIIGLPGEKISYRDNQLYINGEEFKDPYSSKITSDFDLSMFSLEKIPQNSYFVMGDNRPDSLDSRSFGVVPEKKILGKATFILYPFSRFGSVS